MSKQGSSDWLPPLPPLPELPFGGMSGDPLSRLLETGAKNDAQMFRDIGHGVVDGIKDVGHVLGDVGGAIDRGLRSIFSFL